MFETTILDRLGATGDDLLGAVSLLVQGEAIVAAAERGQYGFVQFAQGAGVRNFDTLGTVRGLDSEHYFASFGHS